MTSVEAAEAASYLESLLGKTLQITILDGRLFTGTFRCTDNESNIILSNSFEYRKPPKSAEQKILEQAESAGRPMTKADMTSRFVGLIVIPGEHITRIEVEERRMPSSALAASLAVRGKV